jgi:hypothetical protein
VVETSNKIAKEMLSNVVNNIPVIDINGSATGTFSSLNMDISSNLGTELGNGFTREIGAKVTEAENKLKSLVEEKVGLPKQQLDAALKGNFDNLKNIDNLQALYKKNQDKIQAEIDKLQKGGGIDKLKEQGKKLFKGIKF